MNKFYDISLFDDNSLLNNEMKFDAPVLESDSFLNILNEARKSNNILEIRKLIKLLTEHNESKKYYEIYEKLFDDLEQINDTQTAERANYYLNRLQKSLTEKRTSKINDIDLNKWKQYDDILTDSLWVMDKRDSSGAHNGSYWGNFIPQIPNQLFKRFTKKGDWIIDTFLGSGTSLIECKRLGRNGIGIDLSTDAIDLANNNISKEPNIFGVETIIINDDSTQIDYSKVLQSQSIDKVQLVIMHPPYWDIIKFSENPADLSNAKDLNIFLEKIGKIVDNVSLVLESNRYLAIVIGDKYTNSEWIPLGFLTMQEVLKRNFILKSIIVKNFEETKGKQNQKELWRYRALLGGFYIFKHEYIFLFKKGK